jgi:alkanesulfonate monooxygenase SsuD/methylene tetrahydromethanopterin reductase-like flavin-dependent oxidoreductase (luciferase family)
VAPRLGYLLPTRERIMSGEPETRPLLELAARAEGLGWDSIWIGDSLLARPRHEPLMLLGAVAACVPRVALGTAVLLPTLRNPVLLAHQVATLDRIAEGRLILGVGIARDVPDIRAEFAAAGVPFEKRVGRLLEGLRLCRELWSGKPVSWQGRWTVENGVLGPTPHRPGGPPLWIAGSLPASLERAGRHFDGWLPNDPDAASWGRKWAEVQAQARAAGRDAAALTGAMYLTLAVDEDTARANARLDAYLARYYHQPAAAVRTRQACYAGDEGGAAEWLAGYAAAGASHLLLRFAGEHERHLDMLSAIRAKLGW